MRVILSLIIMINNNNNNHWCGMFTNHTQQKSVNADFILVLLKCDHNSEDDIEACQNKKHHLTSVAV